MKALCFGGVTQSEEIVVAGGQCILLGVVHCIRGAVWLAQGGPHPRRPPPRELRAQSGGGVPAAHQHDVPQQPAVDARGPCEENPHCPACAFCQDAWSLLI